MSTSILNIKFFYCQNYALLIQHFDSIAMKNECNDSVCDVILCYQVKILHWSQVTNQNHQISRKIAHENAFIGRVKMNQRKMKTEIEVYILETELMETIQFRLLKHQIQSIILFRQNGDVDHCVLSWKIYHKPLGT